ncbi:ribonuclease VapC [Sphingomonas zeicaulis]|uniref:type II toxin-antitoxin system VapC family toxin n=1 Tax=Sphingomonas zeicaulis TaxID=1632740 RepID=UPI003D1E69C2
MIVDTSALIAVLLGEDGRESILDALDEETCFLPAPALAEFWAVSSGSRVDAIQPARELVTLWRDGGLTVLPFTADHAQRLLEAIPLYGKGNGRGGLLNLLDLMVYAVAKERDEPLLCTGKDFAATDVVLHPASRPY